MTKEELQLMLELEEKFEKRASEVADILSGLKYLDELDIRWRIEYVCDFHGDIESFADASSFKIKGDHINWEGAAIHDNVSGSFPTKYLLMNDEELRNLVNELNQENQKEFDKKKKQREIAERKRERLLYEQLKAKFENESKD